MKLTDKQKQEIIERFKTGETMSGLAKDFDVTRRYVSVLCKNALGNDYKAVSKANYTYARAKNQRLNNYFMQIAALIARGTTLQEIASETGQSIQYVRWWCKEKLSEKTFNKLIENRKVGLNG